MKFRTWIIINGFFALLWIISVVMCFIGEIVWVAIMIVFMGILQATSAINVNNK